jgi:hypothetical protein
MLYKVVSKYIQNKDTDPDDLKTRIRIRKNIIRDRDVNVHKTNSFLKLNFQFVSISKRNLLFYPYITMIETKIKTNSFKNH